VCSFGRVVGVVLTTKRLSRDAKVIRGRSLGDIPEHWPSVHGKFSDHDARIQHASPAHSRKRGWETDALRRRT
jgi:hypothetical protein